MEDNANSTHWYVIWVQTGMEQQIQQRLEQACAPQTWERIFVPVAERKKRYQGAWHIEQQVVYPGYIFVVTQQVQEFYYELKKVQNFTKLLGADREMLPLKEKEVVYLQRLGGEKQVVEMSTGVIENAQITVIDGPLKGLESTIKKIDRHKRVAWIETQMFGGTRLVQIGLEVISVNEAAKG